MAHCLGCQEEWDRDEKRFIIIQVTLKHPHNLYMVFIVLNNNSTKLKTHFAHRFDSRSN